MHEPGKGVLIVISKLLPMVMGTLMMVKMMVRVALIIMLILWF